MLDFYMLEKKWSIYIGIKKLKFLFRCIKLSGKKFHVEQIELLVVERDKINPINKMLGFYMLKKMKQLYCEQEVKIFI